MEHPKHLLLLPYELRDMIWASCSATGDANGLLRCCRQTKEEFTRYCVLPKDVSQLDKLKILVDSTYDHGIWLKFDYTWQQNGHTRRAVSAVRHMGEPIVRRVAKTIKVNEITVHLHAPRRGHFVGALLMMLAKANDAYYFIYAMSKFPKFNKDNPGRIAIKFFTEMVQLGQSTKEIKNFWECRAPKVLEDPMRKYLSHPGQMPCFYEYFLRCFPLLPDLQKHIKQRAANIMANGVTSLDETSFDHTGDPVNSSWEHINYDTTMDAISVDYFARAENTAGNDDAGLFGASSKVTRQLRALFEPLATDHVVGLRSTCPHLRVVEWPTTSSSSQLSSDASSRWLESYPKGIRYHWGGRNLVDWRFGWEQYCQSICFGAGAGSGQTDASPKGMPSTHEA
ncbi:hypothetical protein FAVG1_03657 [Fusarium avenaceum]|nr:hypothetical protein FAVG1_03657 [Fusarium avenaceum]